jgi:N-acetylmuramate 1-kinase
MEPIVQGEMEISQWMGKSKVIDSVKRIPGDASTRSYYRVEAEKNTYIVMCMEPFGELASALPFLQVQSYFKAAGVPVPEVYDADPTQGLILLEDLGDVTLLKRLQTVADRELEKHLYQTVIDSLMDIQLKITPEKFETRMAAFDLAFDFEKLFWEVNNSIEQFYELHLGRKIEKSDQKIFKKAFTKICETLAQEPRVFTHRDFHSRNIMVLSSTLFTQAKFGEERLVFIDFQDARMGPCQYDLASLLKDSYYQLDEMQVQNLLDYYVLKREALTGERIDKKNFRYVFDMMAVQRNFKAIGSFASFSNKRGNQTYLKYIGNTFENIRRTLLRYPEYADLREVLFHYYYF